MDHATDLATPPIQELATVVLLAAAVTKGGTLSAGASGVVVHVFAGGGVCLVEFFSPFHCVVAVDASAASAGWAGGVAA
jgi:hypothetical protein